MKKIFIIPVFILSFSSSSYSQETDSKELTSNEFGLSVGSAIPMGYFADKDAGRTSSGLASIGYRIQLDYKHLFSENFGIGFLARNQSHNVDPALLVEELKGDFPMYEYRVSTSSWKITSFFLGMFYSFPLSHEQHIYLDFAFSGGISATTTPRAETTIINDSYQASVTQFSAKSQAFGFLIGTRLRYYLTEDLGLSIGADVLSTNPEFDEIQISSQDATGEAKLQDFNADQSISTLNIAAGVLFLF